MVERIDKVIDSVVVGYSNKSDEVIVLFVKLDKNTILDSNFRDEIIISIRKHCSPRHIPQRIVQVPDIPYTLNGKKVEVAVKKLINGNTITNQDSIANPDSLIFYRDYRFV